MFDIIFNRRVFKRERNSILRFIFIIILIVLLIVAELSFLHSYKSNNNKFIEEFNYYRNFVMKDDTLTQIFEVCDAKKLDYIDVLTYFMVKNNFDL